MALTNTLANLSNFLKTIYEPQLVDLIAGEGRLLGWLPKKTARGYDFKTGLEFGAGGGGFTGRGGARPAHVYEPEALQADVAIKVWQMKFDISRPALIGASTSEQAFEDMLSLISRRCFKTLRSTINAVLYRGYLEEVKSFSSNTWTVKGSVDPLRHLANQYIDSYDGSGNKHCDSYKIERIASDTTFVTTGSGNDPQADDYIYLEDSYGNQPDPLTTIISDTGTVNGIDKSKYYLWQSFVYDANDTDLNIEVLIKALHKVEADGASRVNMILLTSPSVLQKYHDTLLAYGRFTGEGPLKLDGGYVAPLTFSGVPLVPDIACPDGYLFFLEKSAIGLWQIRPPEFPCKTETGMVFYADSSYDGYWWDLAWDIQLFSPIPRRLALYKNINTTIS